MAALGTGLERKLVARAWSYLDIEVAAHLALAWWMALPGVGWEHLKCPPALLTHSEPGHAQAQPRLGDAGLLLLSHSPIAPAARIGTWDV